jgi:hypothetical protein
MVSRKIPLLRSMNGRVESEKMPLPETINETLVTTAFTLWSNLSQ